MVSCCGNWITFWSIHKRVSKRWGSCIIRTKKRTSQRKWNHKRRINRRTKCIRGVHLSILKQNRSCLDMVISFSLFHLAMFQLYLQLLLLEWKVKVWLNLLRRKMTWMSYLMRGSNCIKWSGMWELGKWRGKKAAATIVSGTQSAGHDVQKQTLSFGSNYAVTDIDQSRQQHPRLIDRDYHLSAGWWCWGK